MHDENNYIIRNHPSRLIEESWAIIAFFAVTIFNNFKSIRENGEMIKGKAPIIALVVILFCVLYFLLRFFAWRKTTISIKDGLLIYKVDTINKKEHNISISTISNVNLVQNIFEMLMGTYKVKIDTNSLSTAAKTDISIVLGKKEAYEFKQKIAEAQRGTHDSQENIIEDQRGTYDLKQKSDNYFSDPAISEMDDVPENKIVRLTSNQSVVSGLMGIPFISFLILIAIVVAPIVIGIGTSDDKNTAGSIEIYAIMTSAFAIIGMLWSASKNIFKYFNFTVGRDNDRVLLSYGLFTKKRICDSG
jgi:putative membrane protein